MLFLSHNMLAGALGFTVIVLTFGVLLLLGRRSRLEKQLAAFQRVLTGVSGVAYRMDPRPDGVIRFAGGGCRELLGYDAEELNRVTPAIPFISIVHPDDQATLAAKFNHFRSSRDNFSLDYRIVTRNGAVKVVLDQSQGVFDPKGTLVAIEGLITDISQSKRTRDAQRALEEQVKQSQKMEAIGTLAGGIAHDFNNILGAIMGFAELAKRKGTDGSDASEDLDNILAAAVRARNLVGQILTFSRKETSELRPISLSSTIDDVLSFIRATLPTTITIRASLDRTAPLINADPTQIHQILMNLAANAADSIGDSGGTIEISLARTKIDPPQREIFPELKEGDYLVLTVRDSGPGIPQDILPRIFDPFFTTKSVGRGTGLGLSVVHGIVTSHGGAVRVESAPGRGASFSILFPCATDDLIEHPGDSRLPMLGRGERVMFVDDEQALVHLATEILTELNYRVEGFTSSKAAWEAFERAPDRFDLVITDRTMPGMTGMELAYRMKSIRPGLPVVMITGLLGETARLQRTSDRTALLLKPYTTEMLASTIRALLEGKEIPRSEEEQVH